MHYPPHVPNSSYSINAPLTAYTMILLSSNSPILLDDLTTVKLAHTLCGFSLSGEGSRLPGGLAS